MTEYEYKIDYHQMTIPSTYARLSVNTTPGMALFRRKVGAKKWLPVFCVDLAGDKSVRRCVDKYEEMKSLPLMLPIKAD